ncbi:hypothetical protein [Oceanobacillus neutriphilus]|uniref:Uncharacterized protein n=1 Tax=Oceanobacillus neutriphilus TaxID=531815 RepID=A0ABQ2NUD8_9BACI|nr:hypothetical protein [Oceanobacillus neutriphilus]GGP10769.1 hypothetical protein GCM10011346_20210 [Oceanobacillus neutriphilus]
MSENKELYELEKEWKSRMERFTAPEPTREQTFTLLENIRNQAAEEQPQNMRTELEQLQKSRTPFEQMVDLLASQWTFYGMRSWISTAIVMLILTISVYGNDPGESSFSIWLKGMSFLMIVLIAYAFRPRNEGNAALEELSYYPLIQQMFARFVIVMGVQLTLALPLSFFLLGSASTAAYFFGTFTPLFFFGTVGFVSTFWLGGRAGTIITAFLWFVQMLLDSQVQALSLFRLPESDWFVSANVLLMLISILLLGSIILKREKGAQ